MGRIRVAPASVAFAEPKSPGLTMAMSRSGCSIRRAAVTSSPIVPGPMTTTRSPVRCHCSAACSPIDAGSASTARREGTSPMPKHCVSWATSDSPQPPPMVSENPCPGAWQPVMPGSSNRSQAYGRPSRQVRHGSKPRCTHDRIGSRTTRCPSSAPSVTTPTISWPGMAFGSA